MGSQQGDADDSSLPGSEDLTETDGVPGEKADPEISYHRRDNGAG